MGQFVFVRKLAPVGKAMLPEQFKEFLFHFAPEESSHLKRFAGGNLQCLSPQSVLVASPSETNEE